MEDWKREMIWLSIVYRMAERGEVIPVDTKGTRFEFIDDELTKMHAKDVIRLSDDEQAWVLEKNGQEILKKLVGMYDQFLKFEIFGDVCITKELSEERSDDGINTFDHVFDPRFAAGESSEDLRIAMMEYFVEACKKEGKKMEIDPRRIVFLQMLADGKFAEEAQDFWFNLKLGGIFDTIEEIVKNAYHWQDLGNDEEESWEVATAVYTAGRLEERKREGPTCSACGIPLAIFESTSEADGNGPLEECPNPDCGASFGGGNYGRGGEPEFECPNCRRDIYEGQRTCGCGAHIDFSLPAGTVETVTEETAETVYEDDYYCGGGMYYGYTPYGYYDPWMPATNAAAFGFLCGAIIL